MTDRDSEAKMIEKEIDRLQKEYRRTPNRANRFALESRIKRWQDKLKALLQHPPLAI